MAAPPPPPRPSGPPGSLFGAARGPPPPPQRAAGPAAAPRLGRPAYAPPIESTSFGPSASSFHPPVTTVSAPAMPPPPPPPPHAIASGPRSSHANPYDFNSGFASTTAPAAEPMRAAALPPPPTATSPEPMRAAAAAAAPTVMAAPVMNPFAKSAAAAPPPPPPQRPAPPAAAAGPGEPPGHGAWELAGGHASDNVPPPSTASSHAPISHFPAFEQYAAPSSTHTVSSSPPSSAATKVVPAVESTATRPTDRSFGTMPAPFVSAAGAPHAQDDAQAPLRNPFQHAAPPPPPSVSTRPPAVYMGGDVPALAAEAPAPVPSEANETRADTVPPTRLSRRDDDAAKTGPQPAVAAHRGSSGSRARSHFDRLMKREVPAFLRPSSSRTHTPRESSAALQPPPLPSSLVSTQPLAAAVDPAPAPAQTHHRDLGQGSGTPPVRALSDAPCLPVAAAQPTTAMSLNPFKHSASHEVSAPPSGRSEPATQHDSLPSLSVSGDAPCAARPETPPTRTEPSRSDELAKTTAMQMQPMNDVSDGGDTAWHAHRWEGEEAGTSAGCERGESDATLDRIRQDDDEDYDKDDDAKAAPHDNDQPAVLAEEPAKAEPALADASPPHAAPSPPPHEARRHPLPPLPPHPQLAQVLLEGEGNDCEAALHSVSFYPNGTASESSPMSRAQSALPAAFPYATTPRVGADGRHGEGHVLLAGEVLLNEADCEAAMGEWSPRSGAMEPTPLMMSEPGTGGASLGTPPAQASPPAQLEGEPLYEAPAQLRHAPPPTRPTTNPFAPKADTTAPPQAPPAVLSLPLMPPRSGEAVPGTRPDQPQPQPQLQLTPRNRLPLPQGDATPTQFTVAKPPHSFALSPYVHGNDSMTGDSPAPHAPVDEDGDDDGALYAENEPYSGDYDEGEGSIMDDSERASEEAAEAAREDVHVAAAPMPAPSLTTSDEADKAVNPFKTPVPEATREDPMQSKAQAPPPPPATAAAQSASARRRVYAPCFAVFHPSGGRLTVCANVPGALARPTRSGETPKPSRVIADASPTSCQPTQHRLLSLLTEDTVCRESDPTVPRVRATAAGRAYGALVRAVGQTLPFFASTQAEVTYRSTEQVPSSLWAALQSVLPAPMLDVLSNVLEDALSPEATPFHWAKGGGKAIASLLGVAKKRAEAALSAAAQAEQTLRETGSATRRGRRGTTLRSASPRNAHWAGPRAGLLPGQQDGAEARTHPAIGKRRDEGAGQGDDATTRSSHGVGQHEEEEDALAVIQDLLSQGAREAAVEMALESGLHTHAVIISMMCDSKDLYVKSIRAVVEKELEKSSPLAHAYCLFNELDLPPFAPFEQPVVEDDGENDGSNSYPSPPRSHRREQREALQHTWRTHAATLACNYTRQSAEGLIALGDELQQAGFVLEAHTCFLIAHLTPQGSPLWRHGRAPVRPLRAEQEQTMRSLSARLSVLGGFYHPVQGCRAGFLSLTSTLLTDFMQDARIALEGNRKQVEQSGGGGGGEGADGLPQSHGLPPRPRRYGVAFHLAQALWLGEVGLVETSQAAVHRCLSTLPRSQHALFQGPPKFLDELVFIVAQLPPPPQDAPQHDGPADPIATAPVATTVEEAREASDEVAAEHGDVPRGRAPGAGGVPPPHVRSQQQAPPPQPRTDMPTPPPGVTPPKMPPSSSGPPPPQRPGRAAAAAAGGASGAPPPPPPGALAGGPRPAVRPPPLPAPQPALGTFEPDMPVSPPNSAPPPRRAGPMPMSSGEGGDFMPGEQAESLTGGDTFPSPSPPQLPAEHAEQAHASPSRGRGADPQPPQAEKNQPDGAKKDAKPTRSRSMEALLGFFRRGDSGNTGKPGEETKKKKKEAARPMILDTEKPPKYDPVLKRWMVEETEEEKAQAEMVRRGPPKMAPRAATHPPPPAPPASQEPAAGTPATEGHPIAAETPSAGPPAADRPRPQGMLPQRRGPSGSVGRRQYVDMFNSS